MPSSISSSNDRLPGGPWAWTWLAGAAVAVALLGPYEAVLRSHGFTPSVSDDGALWALARGRVRGHDHDEVVALGASRIRLALNTDVFAAVFGRRPVVLAVNTSSCVPVLDHLSKDPAFEGIVLCDVMPAYFFCGIDPTHGRQAEYVRQYETQAAAAPVEEQLRIPVQEHLACRLSQAAPHELIKSLWETGMFPEAGHAHALRDRSCVADYSKADLVRLRMLRQNEALRHRSGVSPARLQQDLRLLEDMVDRIQGRGGRVIFIRLPSSGGVRAIEEQAFPRPLYWDVLAASTTALTIHFADYRELSGFECPEESHLNGPDAVRFTRALARILQKKLSRTPSSAL